ncbi:MAG: integrase arm-type DNA-binding domain-containing protein [Pseudomonadota bacterium]
MGKLSVKSVNAIQKPGMHGDGLGLYLHVSKGGTKSWILRVTVKGEAKRREIGLGALTEINLAKAREKSRELRAVAKSGQNPVAYRDRNHLTFRNVATELHKTLVPTFRNEKHAAQWLASLANHAFDRIGERKIEDIRRDDVFSVLAPIWTKMHPTAKRLKQRIEAVFDWAIGKGYHPGPNPVDGPLRRALGKGSRRPKHHAALPWRQVPEFMAQLSEREAIAGRCLEFIILTAARSGEARGVTWAEVDLENRVWIIPAARMKAELEHRVPLSDAAVAALEAVKGLDPVYAFPSPQRVGADGKPLSINAFRPLLARMGREGLTVHGFRSAFRDWAAESARADRAVAEAALAHQVTGVEGAYFRSDLFERRRDLMDVWGRYATGASGEIVELVRA